MADLTANSDELQQLVKDALDNARTGEGQAVNAGVLKRRVMRFLSDLPQDLTINEVMDALGPFTPEGPVDEYAKQLPDDEDSRRLFRP